jgi:hypothetical protein
MASPSESHLRHRRTPNLTASPFTTTPVLPMPGSPDVQLENNASEARLPASPLPYLHASSRGSPFEALNEWIRGSNASKSSSHGSRLSKVRTGILKTTHDLFRSAAPSRRSSLTTESEQSWSHTKMERAYSADTELSSAPSAFSHHPSAKYMRRSSYDATPVPSTVRTASRARKCLSAHAQSVADSDSTFPKRTGTYEEALRRMDDSLAMWRAVQEDGTSWRKRVLTLSLAFVRCFLGIDVKLTGNGVAISICAARISGLYPLGHRSCALVRKTA